MNKSERVDYILQLAKDNGLKSNKSVKDLEDLLREPEWGLLTWNSFLCESARNVELLLVERNIIRREDSWL
jgi:hypothetical protein